MPLGAARFGLLGGVADLGKLELIETQTFTADQYVDFVSIQETTYNVHFLTFSITECTGALITQISNNGGSSFIASGYQRAVQYGSVGGTFGEDRSTSTITDSPPLLFIITCRSGFGVFIQLNSLSFNPSAPI